MIHPGLLLRLAHDVQNRRQVDHRPNLPTRRRHRLRYCGRGSGCRLVGREGARNDGANIAAWAFSIAVQGRAGSRTAVPPFGRLTLSHPGRSAGPNLATWSCSRWNTNSRYAAFAACTQVRQVRHTGEEQTYPRVCSMVPLSLNPDRSRNWPDRNPSGGESRIARSADEYYQRCLVFCHQAVHGVFHYFAIVGANWVNLALFGYHVLPSRFHLDAHLLFQWDVGKAFILE